MFRMKRWYELKKFDGKSVPGFLLSLRPSLGFKTSNFPPTGFTEVERMRWRSLIGRWIKLDSFE